MGLVDELHSWLFAWPMPIQQTLHTLIKLKHFGSPTIDAFWFELLLANPISLLVEVSAMKGWSGESFCEVR